MPTYQKDPNATLDYTVNWTDWLAPIADTLATVTWLPSTGLTVVSSSNTSTTATAFVSGGTIGTPASLTCRITTLGLRTDDRTLTLRIISR